MKSGENENHRSDDITDDQLGDLEATGQIIAAGEKMEQSVDRIDEVLQIANMDATAFNDALKAFSGDISLEGDSHAEAIIAQMIQQTQEMQ
ncbi:MAG: hypothetical protein HOA21_14585, partial [Rhodospirillaceae bacterium]|nr:hypothetical protein [Rhodospirillaceae bacterium]